MEIYKTTIKKGKFGVTTENETGEGTDRLSVCIRLLSANLGLGKFIDNIALDEQGKQDSKWVSSLMSKVYWNSSYHQESKITEDLARSVRLEFYKSLSNLNLENTPQTKSLLDRLCLTLQLQGENIPLSREELKTAERLTHCWAREILDRLAYSHFNNQ